MGEAPAVQSVNHLLRGGQPSGMRTR